MGWASFLAPVIMKNADRPELGAELEENFCSTDPAIARRFAEATFYADNRADLPKLKTPLLIIQVADDAIAPVSVGDVYAPKLTGKHAAADGRERTLPEPSVEKHLDY